MSTYLSQLEAYAAWWRTTPAPQRIIEAPGRLATARAASMWYGDQRLDPCLGVPEGAPIITRTMLQQYAGAFVGDIQSIAEGGYLGSTSGTTGEPVEVMMCAWALAHYYMHLEWGLDLHGVVMQPGWRVAHVSLGTRAAPGEEAAPLWGGRVARFDAAHPALLGAQIKTYDPHVLSCTPSELARLLDVLEAMLPESSLRAIVTTSEHMSDELRARAASMKELKNIAFMDTYGLSEIGPVAWRCPDGEAWHVPEGSGWVECIAGHMVVTTWRNRAMPLTRYATGDAIERVVDQHVCIQCGHRGQSFWGLMGRAGMALRDARGRVVSPVRWIRVLNTESFGVTRHRIFQARQGELCVTCEVPTAQEQALRRALEEVTPDMRVVWRRFR